MIVYQLQKVQEIGEELLKLNKWQNSVLDEIAQKKKETNGIYKIIFLFSLYTGDFFKKKCEKKEIVICIRSVFISS